MSIVEMAKNPDRLLLNNGASNNNDVKKDFTVSEKNQIVECPSCNEYIENKILDFSFGVCNRCGYHFKIGNEERIRLLFESENIEFWDKNIKTSDPLKFPGYNEKIKRSIEILNINDAVVTGCAKIHDNKVGFAIMDFRFIMGSMGTIVGEKITRMVERATKHNLPIIIVTASGGARMQEGIFSLYQMAKVNAAIKKHNDKGLLYISVLTNPTTGGVTGSFALVSDIIISEPDTTVGFAGRMIIQQSSKVTLTDEFQTAEYMLKHGFVDVISNRKDLKKLLDRLLKIHKKKRGGVKGFIKKKHTKSKKHLLLNNDASNYLTVWETVKIARHKQRPNFKDYINGMIDGFIELHGDRNCADDSAIVGGIGYLNNIPVTIISNAKGKNFKENVERNFGMARPEGYRKTLRLIQEAEKFKRPVIMLIDTPGAYYGVQAEERGQGQAIGKCILENSAIKTPIISVITGEGGSGGALAMAVGDYIMMLQNSIFSLISPEGCALILFKTVLKWKEIAEDMKLTAKDLYEFGVIDEIIPEAEGGVHTNQELTIKNVKERLYVNILRLISVNEKKLLRARYEKIRYIDKHVINEK